MQPILFLVRKEFLQVLRDRAMLVLIFVMPLFQLVLFGYAVSTDVRNLAVVVCDQDRTPTSREFLRRFGNTEYFRLRHFEDRRGDLARYLDRGKATMALVVPVNFERDLGRGSSPRVQLLLDGQDSQTASIAMGYASRIVQAFAGEQVELALLRRPEGRADLHWVVSEPRVWYNPNLLNRNYMVPGVVALLLTMITALLTSMGIVRERELGTLEQIMVTPIRPYQLMIGKTIPFAVLGMFVFLFALLLARLIHRIPVEGSMPLLVGLTAIYLLTTLGTGLFASTLSTTQQQAMFLAWFINIFFILMSGFFFPISNMPRPMQYLTYLDPLRYYLVIVRELLLKGSGLAVLWPQGLVLLLLGVGILGASALRFQKRIS